MRADLETILCKFGRDRAIFVVVEAICAKKFTDGQTDRQTDRQTTDAARFYLAHSHGCECAKNVRRSE